MALEFTIRRQGTESPVMVLALAGCVDSLTAPQVGALLGLIFERHSCPVVLDLEKVEYISSAGWRALVEHAEDVIERRIQLRVACMQPTVRDVFDLIGLGRIISAHETVAAAVAACTGAGCAGPG